MNLLVAGSDPILHRPSKKVAEGQPVRDIVTMLWSVMNQHSGVGLAAPQIGIDLRIFVVDIVGFRQEFINPQIVKLYGGKGTSRESCLSYPGLSVPVVRSNQIIVEGFTSAWEPIRRKLKRETAFAVQHEIDHLDGITIKDKRD